MSKDAYLADVKVENRSNTSKRSIPIITLQITIVFWNTIQHRDLWFQ